MCVVYECLALQEDTRRVVYKGFGKRKSDLVRRVSVYKGGGRVGMVRERMHTAGKG